MTSSLRMALLACASFVGLALAGPALAAYNPSLTIEQSSYKLGAPATVDVFLEPQWELAEYVTFIRFSPELASAYTDTLGDLTLGTLGGAVGAAIVGLRYSPRTNAT